MDGGVQRLRRLGRERRGDRDRAAVRRHASARVFTRSRPKMGRCSPSPAGSRPATSGRSTPEGTVAATGTHAAGPAIDVSAYETQRLFATARDGTQAFPTPLIYRKGLKLDGRTPPGSPPTAPTASSATRRLRRAHAGADRCGLHRRLCQRARRRRIRTRLAQGRPARQQAQHLARPDRRVRGALSRRSTPRAHGSRSAAAPPAASPWGAP